MKVFEVKAIFRVIEGVQLWTVTCEHGLYDHDWGVRIVNEKGMSVNFNFFGPLNNDIVAGLVKDNLIWL